MDVRSVTPHLFEAEDRLREGVAQTRAGKGDTDGIDLSISSSSRSGARRRVYVDILWTDLIAAHDADSARRLLRDPAFARRARPHAAAGRGWHPWLHRHGRSAAGGEALWIPSLDIYLAAGDAPVPFADHLRALEARKGAAHSHRVRVEPEATYAQ